MGSRRGTGSEARLPKAKREALGLFPSPRCVARAFLIARRMDVNVRRRSWSREEGKSGSREAGGEAGGIGEKDGGKDFSKQSFVILAQLCFVAIHRKLGPVLVCGKSRL